MQRRNLLQLITSRTEPVRLITEARVQELLLEVTEHLLQLNRVIVLHQQEATVVAAVLLTEVAAVVVR